MALKIGELLVKEGVITRKQLDEALKSQVIFGGRLGTNLVEMGLVGEDDLVRYLSMQLEVPFVPSEQLLSIPPDVIKLISREMADEYKIIPLSLDKKRLTVAMWDPSDLSAVDAISFITGYIIKPLVCSELRLLLALEQYYGIKREVRYIQLSGGSGVRTRETAPESQKAPAEAPEVSPFETMSGAPVTRTEPEWGELAEILPTEANTGHPSEILHIGTQQTGLPVEEPDIVELVEPQPETPPPTAPKVAPSAPPKVAAPATPAAAEEPPPSSLDAVLSLLAEAKDRDAIADALAAYLGQDFERVALFMVKGKVAAGWKGRVRKEPIPGFENFQLPLDEPSALKIAADTKNFYLGPLLDTTGNKRVLAALGGSAPDTALLIPLMMMGRVVTIFYVDGGHDLGKNLFELQKLVGKASLAFEILILKNKILLG
ncbi:MAG TPA: hypothetical protein VI298_02475 [Geobacteraceae bacterium]